MAWYWIVLLSAAGAWTFTYYTGINPAETVIDFIAGFLVMIGLLKAKAEAAIDDVKKDLS